MKFLSKIRFTVALMLSLPFGVSAQTTYTIGGENTDFPTFTAAVDFLATTTLTDAVIFNIQTGVYDEHVVLPTVDGASEQYTITFQSESLDASTVTLTAIPESNPTTGIVNNVLRFSTAQWYILQHLTIQQANTPETITHPASVLYFEEDAHNNKIQNCHILGAADGMQLADLITIAGDVGVGENTFLHIESNRISNGKTGVITGNWSGQTIFKDNVLTNLQGNGIDGFGIQDLLLEGNEFSYIGEVGLSLSEQGIGNLQIIGNYFHHITEEVGYFTLGSRSETSTEIINNIVQVDGASGWNFDDWYNIKLYNNTLVNITSGGTLSFFAEFCSNIHLRNNLFYTPVANFPFRVQNVSDVSSDYNNIFQAADNPHVSPNSSAALTEGEHSTKVDPGFVAGTFLPQAAVLRKNGESLPSVITDYNGNMRPDPIGVGALIISAADYDISIAEIITPQMPLAAGTHPVELKLVNNGLQEITSVTIPWSINGNAQTPYVWTGNLSPNAEVDITIGQIEIFREQSTDLRVRVELPVEQTENYLADNTKELDEIVSGLIGVYTVGESGDFVDMTTAFEAIEYGGIYGDVQLNIMTGNYSGRHFLSEYAGGKAYTLTIQSITGDARDVTFTYNQQLVGGIFNFQFSSNIILRNLTVQHNREATLGNASLIYFLGNGDNLLLEDLNLLGLGNHTDQRWGIRIADGIRENITIRNCQFKGMRYGISISNLFRPHLGNIQNVTIENNNFDTYLSAIELIRVHDFYIKENLINTSVEFDERYSNHVSGIHVSFHTGQGEIISNQLHSRSNGVLSVGGEHTNVELLTVANNYIYAQAPSTSFTDLGVAYFKEKHNLLFAHNTIRTDYTDENVHGLVHLQDCSNVQLLNNILTEQGEMRLFYLDNLTGINQFNHNVIFNQNGSFARLNEVEYSTFTDWKNATGLSQQSVFDEPIFADNTYRTYSSIVKSAGIPLSTITTDIENNARNEEGTDIGCFEQSDFTDALATTWNIFDLALTTDNTVLLNWQTTDIAAVIAFDIQRSADGKEFTSIGEVTATNTSTYRFTDNEPSLGLNYYRIVAVTATEDNYSSIKNIAVFDQVPLTVFPNPTTGTIKINLPPTEQTNAQLAIFNATGEQVYTRKIANQQTLNLQQLPTGMYLLVVKGEQEKWTKCFVIAR